MNENPSSRQLPQFKIVYWIIWAAILLCLIGVQFVLERRPLELPQTPKESLVGLAGLVPLFVSIIIRWLVLPKFDDPQKALPMFIVGLGLAEGSGILGVFHGGEHRNDLFLLAVLGVVQYLPYLLTKLFKSPEPALRRFPDR